MKDGEKLNLEQIRALPGGQQEVDFRAQNREELYAWANQTLGQQD